MDTGIMDDVCYFRSGRAVVWGVASSECKVPLKNGEDVTTLVTEVDKRTLVRSTRKTQKGQEEPMAAAQACLLRIEITNTATGEKRIVSMDDPRVVWCEEYNHNWPGGEFHAEMMDDVQPAS